MSDILNTSEIEYLHNDRYSILTENNEFKSFGGLVTGLTNELVEYKGKLYTPGHKIKIDDRWVEVSELSDNRIEANNIKVYDVLDVEEYHSFVSNDLIHKNCLILDEFAFVDHTAEFMKAAFPVISSAQDKKNSKIVILSTPNGMNDFYQIWRKAKAEVNDFQWFKIDWRDVPRNVSPEEFKSQEIAKSDAITFEQEYGCVDPSTIVTVKDALGNIKDITVGELGELLK